ncbi:MAG TPA: pirin family protein [Candidatus Bathyarchaeia archaeon]|nr:pirin family protein [Candidatus Bathyarchaeia archaeon]
MSSQKTENIKITVRPASTLYQASGRIQEGTFRGRWHFSFDTYNSPQYNGFGNLRVLNDDTLSPGAVWPLHPHTQNEVVTYVVEGEFRHEDERGKGGVLHNGGVQHTTVGRGMYHSEINNRRDIPMRFIQIWYYPEMLNMTPSVEQQEVDRSERTNQWLPLVAYKNPETLPLRADGAVLSSFLQPGHKINCQVREDYGLYLYVLEGGPVSVNDRLLPEFNATQITGEGIVATTAEKEAELLLLEVNLTKGWPTH